MLKISVFDQQKNVPINKAKVRKQLKHLIHFLKIDCDELEVYFVSKKKISVFHQKLFNDPSPTDTISILIDAPSERASGTCFLGEIYICPKVAEEYSSKKKKKLSEELSLYLIHGLLHLIGFKDENLKDKKNMRKKEKICMKFLEKEGLT